MHKPDRIPAMVRADAPAAKLARRVIKQRIEAATMYWRQVAKRDVPRVEDIHQLRVWSRRAVAALQLFAPMLAPEPAGELLHALNKTRKRAGKARDCDVLLQTLDQSEQMALAQPLAALQEQRRASCAKLIRSHRKKVRSGEIAESQAALFKSLRGAEKSVSANDGQHAGVEFGPWFLQQFATISVNFLRQLQPARPVQRRIHALRIEGKRVRYALEIGLPSLPKKEGKGLYAALEQLQQQLGDICDDQALAEQYHGLATNLKPRQRMGLNKAAARHEQQARAGFLRFCRWWNAATGRKLLLRRLAAILTPPEVAALAQSNQPRTQRRKSQAK